MTGLGRRLPLIGRERELDVLSDCHAAAARGEGGVVLLAGEPGIGKTRLLTELAALARSGGWTVLAGRADEGEGVPPYLPVVEALRQFLLSCPPDRLRPALGKSAATLVRLVPELRDALPDLPKSAAVGVEENRYRLFEAVTGTLHGIARLAEGPGLLVLLDDLHWADTPTLLLLRHIARARSTDPTLVVLAHRSAEADISPALGDLLAEVSRQGPLARLTLPPLSRDAAATLVAAEAGKQPSSAVADAIHRVTGGNPYFVVEMVRQWQAEGRDLATAGSVAAGWTAPEGVARVIGARLARLAPETRRLLHLSAVLGERVDGVVLAAAAADEHALLDALDEATAAGMLRPAETGDGYAFAHALVREVLLAELGPLRRQRLHRRAAEAIEAVHAGRLAPHAAALAGHYRLAGPYADAEKAIEYSLLAGETARSVFAFAEAAVHWQAALERLEAQGADPERRAALLERLAGLMKLTDVDRVTGLAYLERALALYERAGDRERVAELHARIGVYLWSSPETRDVARAMAHFRAAEPVLRAGPDTPALSDLYQGLAAAEHLQLRPAAALIAATRAIEVRERLDNPLLATDGARLRGYSLAGVGRVTEGLATDEDAWEVADRADAAEAGFLSASARGLIALRLLGDAADGAVWLARERARPRHAQTRHLRRILGWNLGEAYVALGRLDDARRTWAEFSPIMQPHADLLAFWSGDWDVATCAWPERLELFRRTGDRWNEWYFTYELGRACQRWGDGARAAALLDDALVFALVGPHIPAELATRAALALQRARAGDPAAARSHLARCREILAAGEDWRARAGLVALAEASVLVAEGHPLEAGRPLAEAVAVARRYRLPWDEAEALEGWGHALRAAGDRRGAAERLEEAAALYRRQGAGERWVERLFANAPTARSEQPDAPFPDGLSVREVEVLRLVAAGRSNRAIAADLAISLNTVLRHMTHILRKTGAANRAEAASYAHRHRLAD